MKKFLAILFLVSISLQVIGQVFTLGSNKKGDFDILINQAEQKRRDGKYDSSLILLNNALKIAESQEDLEWKAKVKNEIGLLAIYQGKFAKALEYIQESLAIYEHLKIEEGIADCFNNMASIQYSQKNYELARDNFTKSLIIREKSQDLRQLGIGYNNLGTINAELNDPDSALEYHRKALDIWQKLESKSGIAITLSHIGKSLKQKGEYTQALQEFNKSLAMLSQTSSDLRSKLIVETEIGKTLNELGQFNEAERYCIEVYDQATTNQSKLDLLNSCECLYMAYKGLGNKQKALTFYEQFIQMRDILAGQEMTKQITSLELSYAFNKQKQADSLRYEAEAKLSQVQIQRQYWGLITVGAMLLLAAIMAIVIYKSKQKSDSLLLNILPKATADELKAKGSAEAKYYDSVTVLFTDFKGFTQISETLSPQKLVSVINECFGEFDRIMEKHGIEKIKTIGDAYMAVGGLPNTNKTHAVDVIKAALDIHYFMTNWAYEKKKKNEPYFEVRIGVNSGPVVAGIVGINKFQYDIWGDTVNTASRMESMGQVGRINISQSTYEQVHLDFECQYRGEIDAKGKGKVKMYFVNTQLISETYITDN